MIVLLSLVAPRHAAADQWSPTEPMRVPRSDHTATLLPSGKILIAGGNKGDAVADVEVYDPLTGTWTTTEPMAAPRYRHTATLLPSGKVMVVGGVTRDFKCLAEVEIYDPRTGSWSAADSLSARRADHTATLLPSGEVLVAGGHGGEEECLQKPILQTELYDLGEEEWLAAGSLEDSRHGHTSTLLSTGQVMIIGGISEERKESLASVEIYSRTSVPSWQSVDSLDTARGHHTATLLPSGDVLVTGGFERATGRIEVFASAEIYEQEAKAWRTIEASMLDPRANHSASLLPSGDVLLASGAAPAADGTVSAELFDPGTERWSAAQSLRQRSGHTATLLRSGDVLVTGGFSAGATVDVYTQRRSRLENSDALEFERCEHTATTLESEDILVVGGRSSFYAKVERYDQDDETWTTDALAPSQERRSGHTSTRLASGDVLVVGGNPIDIGGSVQTDQVELYDVDERTWETVGALHVERVNHTATLLPSGEVLVVGGSFGLRGRETAELYDPREKTWAMTGSLTTPRQYHTATLLPSGDVLVVGGFDPAPRASAEIYDRRSQTWRPTADLATARALHTATLLPSGRVLVVGGDSSDSHLADAEIYDPQTERWSTVGSLADPRANHTATLLPSGEVLVVGGEVSFMTLATSVELFDPSTLAWSTVASLPGGRLYHTATLTSAGDVLIVGGRAGSTELKSALILGLEDSWDTDRAPIVEELPEEIEFRDPEQPLVLSVRGLLGGSEAHGGSRSSSAANVPFVRLQSLAGDRQIWLEPDEIPSWGPPPWDGDIWDESMALRFSDLPATLHPGQYRLSVVTAGIPSSSELIDVACGVWVSAPTTRPVARNDSAVFDVVTRGAVTFEWETCHGDPTTVCAPPADPTKLADRGGPGWRPIPGATDAVLITEPVQGPEAGSLYRAVAHGLCASERSVPALLTVDDRNNPGAASRPPVAIVSPGGGELWPLSKDLSPSRRDITWTMSDDVRVCRVDLTLLHSDDGGLSFPGATHLATFGSVESCYNPGELTTRFTYTLPEKRPAGLASSLYKIKVKVTDHAGNWTEAESAQPFFIIEPSNDSVRTLILWHPDRMGDLGMATEELAIAVANLAAHPAVRGRIVDLGLPDALDDLYRRWDDGLIDANTVLFGDAGLHDYLHDEWLPRFPAVESLILIGDDRFIPFARLDDGTAAATVVVSEEAYPDDPASKAEVDLTIEGTRIGAALEENLYLSDDPLATRGGFDLETIDELIFLPDLGIGRLVETPSEISRSIATFIGREGVLDLSRYQDPVFVSAYDFLVDTGTVIRDRWDTVLGAGSTTALIGQSWTPEDLTTELCDVGGYGLLSLNGHATHYEIGHPSIKGPYDIVGVPAADLAGCDLAGSVVYAIGCHSGLPIPDDPGHPNDHPEDLPQEILEMGALAYLGNTGYGWGLKHGIGYSERLVDLFSQELSAGDGIEIGEAVRRTKMRYYLESPYLDAYDEKVSMQWTLFGFPMLRVSTGAVDKGETHRPFAGPLPKAEDLPYRQRVGSVVVERRFVGTTVVDGVEVTPPPYLSREPRSFDFRGDRVYKLFNAAGEEVGPGGASADYCDRSKPDPDPTDAIPQGCYYTLNGLTSGQNVHSGAADRPLQPLLISDVGLSGTRFHGFLWLGGTYVEREDWVPIIAELQSNVDGGFSDHGALPSNSRSNGRGKIRHGSVLGDLCSPTDLDRTSLVLEAGETLRGPAGEHSIERHYEVIDTELFYYNNTDEPAQNCDVTGPRVVAEHTVSGSRVTWEVRPYEEDVHPREEQGDSIWRVIVVWTDNTVDAEGRGQWRPLELKEVAGRFGGSLEVQGSDRLTYFIQAVDQRGNVSVVQVTDQGAASGVTHELPEVVEIDFSAATADLGVSFAASTGPVPGLTTMTATARLVNFGPEDAAGISVEVELPADLTDAGSGGDGWDCAVTESVLRCTRSLLEVGSVVPLTLSGTAPHQGQIDLKATVRAASRDPVAANDTAQLSIPVQAAPHADLQIVHTAELDANTATLLVRVQNDGPANVRDAIVSAPLPAMFSHPTWRCAAGEGSGCRRHGVGPLVSGARLASGSWVEYTVTASVAPDVRAVVETKATVTPPAGVHDPSPGSNTSTALLDLASPIFADGFEAGSLDAWSTPDEEIPSQGPEP